MLPASVFHISSLKSDYIPLTDNMYTNYAYIDNIFHFIEKIIPALYLWGYMVNSILADCYIDKYF